MPNHKTINAIKTILFFISKNSTKSVPWKLFLGPFVFIENYAQTQLEK